MPYCLLVWRPVRQLSKHCRRSIGAGGTEALADDLPDPENYPATGSGSVTRRSRLVKFLCRYVS
jgi:hypothetical protein